MSPPPPHVLVLGAGSSGARHAATLQAAGARVSLCDPDAERSRGVAAHLGPDVEAVAFDLDRLDRSGALDGAVVASPTVHHVDQAAALLDVAPRVLVEKPLALDAASATPFLPHRDRVAVALNLRFHEPLVRLVEMVEAGQAGAVSGLRLWFGQWLPDWRPGSDYRTGYSARRDLGGGVLLDLVHELDVLVWLCGPGPHQVVGAHMGRHGPLDIDVEDTVKAIVRTADGAVADPLPRLPRPALPEGRRGSPVTRPPSGSTGPGASSRWRRRTGCTARPPTHRWPSPTAARAGPSWRGWLEARPSRST